MSNLNDPTDQQRAQPIACGYCQRIIGRHRDHHVVERGFACSVACTGCIGEHDLYRHVTFSGTRHVTTDYLARRTR